jgi:Ca-activated chloride channel family protein
MLRRCLFAFPLIWSVSAAAPVVEAQGEAAPGQLTVIGKDGKAGPLCPLKGTEVNAEIAGFGARVTVVQTFVNPTKEPIEAIYTFPLPHEAAVDRMRMKVGERIVNGLIKRREEAQAIYREAKERGMVAGLLDQERPNIFTQSVANIMPGAKVEIEISYVQLLDYGHGRFEFAFPMVVGPRFLGEAPDPDRISPPITPKGTRTGADIKLIVQLDAGAPIKELTSVLHEITTKRIDQQRAVVSLAKKDEIPNRDFILRYSVATDNIGRALLTHANGERGGYFTLILTPPKAPKAEQISPKEMIFVIDQSGSQRGFPIEKSKELTKKLIDTMGPDDTFNVVTFANSVRTLWPQTTLNSPESRAEAKEFVSGLSGNGGTHLLAAVKEALTAPSDPRRLRIVVFNTDGFVGNEFEILDAVKKHRDTARMFTFGIGNGVNRFLIDGMSAEGKGDAEYVTLAEQADEAVERFVQRVRSPVLTDVTVSFEGLAVADVLPAAVPDVFSDEPVVVKGRYTEAGRGRVVIKGKLGGKPWSTTVDIDLPPVDQSGSAIATLWAREKVDELMRENWLGQSRGQEDTDLKERIINLALDYGIMTQYTSFVAVEERVVNVGGKQRTVQVPVEMTEGVSYEGIFGPAGGVVLARGQVQAKVSAGVSGGYGGYGGGGGAPVMWESLGGVDYEESLDAQVASGEMTPEQRRQALYELRVAESLRAVKSGTVEVQVYLKEWKDEEIEQLEKLGLSIDARDKGLKVLFGTVEAAKLIELAQVGSVHRIMPLDEAEASPPGKPAAFLQPDDGEEPASSSAVAWIVGGGLAVTLGGAIAYKLLLASHT